MQNAAISDAAGLYTSEKILPEAHDDMTPVKQPVNRQEMMLNDNESSNPYMSQRNPYPTGTVSITITLADNTVLM